MNRGPVLTALKDATMEKHRALEAVSPLMRQPLKREDYVEHLVGMAGFQIPLEQKLNAAHDWNALGLSVWNERQRETLLTADLAALNVKGWQVAHLLPPVLTLDEAIGCLYVLEGSTLGGQVLTRRLAEQFDPPVPTTYLNGAGDLTGKRWQEFCAFAERSTLKVEDAVRAANETFVTLTTWLLREKRG